MMMPSNAADKMIHLRLRISSHESDRVVSMLLLAVGAAKVTGVDVFGIPDGELLFPKLILG